jgi:putative glutamine amidotransferase
LAATAWAADGLVEAIEDPRSDRFVMGVQWHPELGWERDSLSRALFNRFVTEAANFSALRSESNQTTAAVWTS